MSNVIPIHEQQYDALIELIRQAMASGVACFTEKLHRGDLSRFGPDANIGDMLEDWPEQFIWTRRDLVEAALDDKGVSA